MTYADHIEEGRLDNSVAIIGMSGRFPGADSTEELWQHLAAGVVSTTPSDPDTAAQVPDGHIAAWGKVNRPEYFAAPFFNIAPADAQLLG